LPGRLPVLHLELAEISARWILEQDVAGAIPVKITRPNNLRTGRRPADVLPARLAVLHVELVDMPAGSILKQDVTGIIAVELVWLRRDDREIESRGFRADVAEVIGLYCGERVNAWRQFAR
jgi:hypothetical protein